MKNQILIISASIIVLLTALQIGADKYSGREARLIETKSSKPGDCTVCHGDILADSVKHIPATQACVSCHESTGAEHPSEKQGFRFPAIMPDLCYICHSNKAAKKYTHIPAQGGECMFCHSPHSSNSKGLLTQAKTSELCYTCHETKTPEDKIIHTSLKGGQCENCHDAHHSDYSKLLSHEPSELCFSCHTEKQKLLSARYIHPIFQDCSTCHKPHYSEFDNLLVQKYPKGLYAAADPDNFTLCFNCHNSEILTAQKTTDATNFRNGDQNLHYLHINGTKGSNCTNCHNVHASENEHIIRKSLLFGNWDMPIKYTKKENGGSCFPGCHKEYSYLR